jgi:hypothetical protein
MIRNNAKRIRDFINLPVQTEIEELKKSIQSLSDNFNNESKNLYRSLIKQRWTLVDVVDDIRFADYTFECIICNKPISTKNTKKVISQCIFGGGKLTRFKCPHCGAIIGPLKMLNLTPAELSDDYQQHYNLYSESDTTEYEKFTFFQLNPTKKKKYLNYGCGSWSRSINELRDAGYDVYGFEPYAGTNSPFIITSFDELKKHKFDGIFTHDLIEHLRNPVEDFAFLKTLLKNKSSEMAHATGCYEYAYEYSRFHLVFYTGDSLKTLCDQVGLIPCHKASNVPALNDKYICYNFKQQ